MVWLNGKKRDIHGKKKMNSPYKNYFYIIGRTRDIWYTPKHILNLNTNLGYTKFEYQNYPNLRNGIKLHHNLSILSYWTHVTIFILY